MCQVQGLVSHCHITVLPSRRFDPFIPLEPGNSGVEVSIPGPDKQSKCRQVQMFSRPSFVCFMEICQKLREQLKGGMSAEDMQILSVSSLYDGSRTIEKVKKQERCVCNEKGKRKVISQWKKE